MRFIDIFRHTHQRGICMIVSNLYLRMLLIRYGRVELLKIVVEQFNSGVIKDIKYHLGTNRNSVVRRITVLLLILYLFAMVNVGRYVYWDLWHGFSWASWSYTLFPFPTEMSGISLPVVMPLNPIEVFIYLFFIGQGIWVAWMFLGVLYIMMPLVRRGYSSLGRFNSKPEQRSSDIVEPVSRFTKSAAVLAVFLSTGTFIVNLAIYGPVVLLVVLGLSIVVFWSLLVEDRNVTSKMLPT